MSHLICHSDACQQGRMPCPCPSACESPEAETAIEQIDALIDTALLVVLAFGVAAFIGMAVIARSYFNP